MASKSQLLDKDKPLSMATLLSPPEPKRWDSFTNSPMLFTASTTPQSSFASEKPVTFVRDTPSFVRGDRGAYASPPISPCQKPQNSHNDRMEVEDESVKDPPLFRSGDSVAGLSPEIPLFPQDRESIQDAVDVASVVSDHIARNNSVDPSKRPTRSEYMLAVSCVPQVGSSYNRDRLAWLKRERHLLFNHYGRKNRVEKGAKLRRIAPAPSPATKRQKVSIPALPRTARMHRTPSKRTPQSKVSDSFDEFAPSSPKPSRAPTNRDDVDYQALPDYSPPTSSLPKGNSKVLKADWKGQMLDLSSDPDRHQLHEAEINLAATLRLSCATYLCSKRRIFIARIEALRIGKEFRKTDAQQACKIDVNKASKLWAAYEKVGWFKRDLFARFV